MAMGRMKGETKGRQGMVQIAIILVVKGEFLPHCVIMFVQ